MTRSQLLNNIAHWLREGGLRALVHRVELERTLSLRDSDPFDSAWVAANDEVQRVLRERALTEGDSRSIEDIARLAFEATTGCPALAPYVSDDLRLIAEAVALGLEFPWISGLFEADLAGDFPFGAIRLSDSRLSDLPASMTGGGESISN